MMNKFKFIAQLAVSTLAMLCVVTPSYALPGENIADVLKWVKTKPQLPILKYSDETLTYFGKKGNLQFFISARPSDDFSYLYPPSWYIHSESIEVTQEPQINFSRKTAKAIKLINDIYSTKIASDFRRSQYITTIHGMSFYKGAIFAYITIDSQKNLSSWDIINLTSLQQEIDNAKLSAN
ncbi:hypothetical protein VB713_16430 [Anabaena cylindrica UHCC 0172]|uniref:hypothetical protein n=1 Tax=Anabaena cylindrica TaxID=1165 RepID=UPI002B1F6A57|nr:hypothetical protein [Anabaena cylindrica]MEA5552529.1 hypothetical protein [Anabaena cylindrica UHCC 0172]